MSSVITREKTTSLRCGGGEVMNRYKRAYKQQLMTSTRRPRYCDEPIIGWGGGCRSRTYEYEVIIVICRAITVHVLGHPTGFGFVNTGIDCRRQYVKHALAARCCVAVFAHACGPNSHREREKDIAEVQTRDNEKMRVIIIISSACFRRSNGTRSRRGILWFQI